MFDLGRTRESHLDQKYSWKMKQSLSSEHSKRHWWKPHISKLKRLEGEGRGGGGGECVPAGEVSF